MATSRESLRRTYPAIPASLPVARSEVVDYARIAGLDAERLDGVRLAVSEAVTNAIRHAYLPERDGEVHIAAAVLDEQLVVRVVDDGCGYRTPSRSPGPGYGLALMAHAADELQLAERAEGGTEARMTFQLVGAS